MPYEECDEATIWRESKVRARKEHRCCECGEPIPPGMEYGRATSLYEGGWSTHSRCSACLILAEWVATVTGYCPLWCGLCESVDNANDEHETYDEELDEYVQPFPDPLTHRRRWDAIAEEPAP
jgi:hypothetical protein